MRIHQPFAQRDLLLDLVIIGRDPHGAVRGPGQIQGVALADSKYVMQGIDQWIHGWKARGWKTADKKPVKNEDLWKRLDTARARHNVHWRWVKGHSGHELNDRADALANRGVDEVLAAKRGRLQTHKPE